MKKTENRSDGVLEYWGTGMTLSKSILHYSNTPLLQFFHSTFDVES